MSENNWEMEVDLFPDEASDGAVAVFDEARRDDRAVTGIVIPDTQHIIIPTSRYHVQAVPYTVTSTSYGCITQPAYVVVWSHPDGHWFVEVQLFLTHLSQP